MTQSQSTSDDDQAPGETLMEEYRASESRHGGSRGEFLWFVTADGKRDQIFPMADIRRMEPPSEAGSEIAYIHFSGVSVALMGSNLRRILHRITLQRCAALYEVRKGQRKPAPGEPIIERMEFLDMTRASPKAEGPDGRNVQSH